MSLAFAKLSTEYYFQIRMAAAARLRRAACLLVEEKDDIYLKSL